MTDGDARRRPAWARTEEPSAIQATLDAAAEAHDKNAQELAKERSQLRGIAHFPLDPAAAAQELSDERRVMLGSRPRGRRWKALARHDDAVDQVTQKHADAIARLQEAEQALQHAPQDDARSVADWLAAGENGERPAATLYERERDRDAARLLVDAVAIELDKALERRRQHIEAHREKMLGDLRKMIDAARDQLRAKVQELLPFRDELLEARAALVWLAHYPEHPASYGFPTAVAIGLAEPVKRTLGTKQRIEYAHLVALLEEDAEALAGAFHEDTRRQLGVVVRRSPEQEAMWWDSDDPDLQAYRAEQRERLQKLADEGFVPRADLEDAAKQLR
jgi:hypothetical protein